MSNNQLKGVNTFQLTLLPLQIIQKDKLCESKVAEKSWVHPSLSIFNFDMSMIVRHYDNTLLIALINLT